MCELRRLEMMISRLLVKKLVMDVFGTLVMETMVIMVGDLLDLTLKVPQLPQISMLEVSMQLHCDVS